MTQRERQASGGVPETAPRPAPHPVASARRAAVADTAWGTLWEELYRSTSPAQQSALLSLASQQGLLYAHQLPPAPPPTDRSRQLISRLLNGQIEDLAPSRPAPIEIEDSELDAAQREAVARALATPDICLIQGLPGTGKSRVVAEIITRACARGDRVLLLAPHAAAIDRTLEGVGGREVVFAVRCVGGDERPESLSEGVRAFTLAERTRWLREHTLDHARREVAAAEQRCDRRRQERELWSRLEELAGRSEDLAAQGEELAQRLAEVPAEVEREAAAAEAGSGAPANPFTATLAETLRIQREALIRLDGEHAEVARQMAEKRDEERVLAAQLEALRPLLEAKQAWRWWTPTFWKATFQGGLSANVETLRKRLAEIGTALSKLEQDAERLAARRDELGREFQAGRSRLVTCEIDRRSAELHDQMAAVEQERRLLGEKWQETLRGLEAGGPLPTTMTRPAVAVAGTEWGRQVEEEEERQAFARQWATCVEEAVEDLPARLRGLVNLVAGTTTAVRGDEHFGETTRDLHFDLLVLVAADQITESEFLAAIRRARRWVLVGDPSPECEEAGEGWGTRNPGRKARGSRASHRPVRSDAAGLQPGFFHRLWQQLHCEPRRLSYRWVLEGDRLCCQLRPVDSEQRRWLETECVADFPDVELRILSVPRARSVLAEVAFPRGMSIDQAKEYIFRELEELPVRAEGHSLRWEEEADRLVLRLGDCRGPHTLGVHLEEGVREMVMGQPATNGNAAPSPSWHTCCIEFHRSAGWERDRAEEWVQRHLGVRDLGRTVHLDVPHRMDPHLARFLSDLLFTGAYQVCSEARPTDSEAPVHFVPVPPLAPQRPKKERRPEGGPGGRPPAPKGGAGLELDLADGRHRDRLPSELRPLLGERGLVNYLEAQAVVRALEQLVQHPPSEVRTHSAADGPMVGVIALYAAQAELIRRLIEQVPALAALGTALKVDIPAAFREQECSTILLSLTRSHTHRAVSFGEGPHHLALALTRARRRLIIFGDTGTLARRCQWEEPLDHLDQAASAREHAIVTRLVGYVNGQGRHGEAFHLWTGSSA